MSIVQAQSRMIRVLGVLVFRRLSGVSSCCQSGGNRSLVGWSGSLQRGQGLIEYVIVFGLVAIMLSTMWSGICSLAGAHSWAVWLIHVTYGGWADWLAGY